MLIYDRFDRADTAAGVIGRSTSDIPWLLSGTGFDTCQIINNRFQSGDPATTSETVYIIFNPRRAVKWMKAKVLWDAGANTQDVGIVAMDYDPPFVTSIVNNSLHMALSTTIANIQIFDKTVFSTLASTPPLALDRNVSQEFAWTVIGNQIILVGPGFVISAVSTRIGVIQSLLKSFYFQISAAGGTALTRVYFLEIMAGIGNEPYPEILRSVLE